MAKSALVIGGGMIGLLTARALAMRHVVVTLLEQDDIGRASSWAGGGILSPLQPWRYPAAVNTLVAESQRLYPDLCAELARSTGIDAEWTPSGLLILNADIPAATAWAERWQLEGHALSGAQVSQIEPAAAPVSSPVFWMPGIAQLRNPRLLRALRADLEGRGVRLVTNTPITEISPTDQGIAARSDNLRWQADIAVVSAGAWSSRLLASWGGLPVHPVKGQMIQLATPPGTVRRIVLEDTRYVIPRRDGLVLVGSTLEETGFDADITPAARQELHEFAVQRLPVLRSSPIVRQWAGLRPAAPQGIPIIGPHPSIPRLFINAGHYRNGVAMAPASAKLIADLILDIPSSIDPSAYQM